MLVFFMHGVATRDVLYARPLQNLIQQEFTQRQLALPHFYTSFWGDVLSDVGKLWNAVHHNLQTFKSAHPDADLDTVFRYQNFRKGFFSEFVGDAFTYLNSERGFKIRQLLTEQLHDFINRNPHESELHIIAHSLGTVVLWDALFSDRFQPDDPAFTLREMVQGPKLRLSSITTMGSPIAFFNMMLGIQPEQVKALVQQYCDRPLRWVNLIHASDIIAYPMQACLTPDSSWNLVLKDHYLQTPANAIETTLHQWVQSNWVQQGAKALNSTVQMAVEHAPMVAGAGDGHVNYWNCPQVAQLISDHLLANTDQPTTTPTLLTAAIAHLQQVPGITPDRLQLSHLIDEILIEAQFRDQSGSLRLTKNLAGIHHAYVLDSQNTCQFGGYVGWLYVSGLKQAVATIQTKFCS